VLAVMIVFGTSCNLPQMIVKPVEGKNLVNSADVNQYLSLILLHENLCEEVNQITKEIVTKSPSTALCLTYCENFSKNFRKTGNFRKTATIILTEQLKR
jgi:adenosine/AMP kinase